MADEGELPELDETRKPVSTKPKHPDDFADAASFLAYIRKTTAADWEADKPNREPGQEDGKFLVGGQWDAGPRAKRARANKPILSENYLPAFIGQVTGNRRLNETVIKVMPDNGGTKAIAAIREGLIRNIQKNSVAEIAYNGAHLNQVTCGIGNFKVELDYAYADVFEQDARIKPSVNPFSVVWDRLSVDPTGADAHHVTEFDKIPRGDFERLYPKATPADVMQSSDIGGALLSSGWLSQDDVRVAYFRRMRTRKRTIALLTDGKVVDVTGKPELLAQVMTRDDGTPVMRDALVKYEESYLVSGMDILDGPYELPISTPSVFRVPGWELNVGDERHRWGIIRFLKDPQRLHNYWVSVKAEKYTQSPKASWVARAGAVQGREKEWRESHTSDNPLLIFNDDAAEPPIRVPPVQIEPALIEAGAAALQAMRDISNIHEASLGQQSNEVSGKAIIARQRVGELGTVLYQDNLNLAIERCGKVLNELIPHIYDTNRIVKILGPDDKAALVEINNPNSANTDITAGKYSVSIVTGPSYVTRRVEAAEGMLNLINAAPQLMATTADLVVEAQDWPMAEEFARRLRMGLPAGTVPEADMSEEQKAQAQAQAQAQQQTAALAQQMAVAHLEQEQAKVDEIRAKIELTKAQTEKTLAEPVIKAGAEHAKATHMHMQDQLAAIEVAEPPHPKEKPENGKSDGK